MDTQNNRMGWVIGVAVLLVVVLGLWWFMQSSSTTNTNANATTTPQVATTTTQGAAAVNTEVRSGTSINAVLAEIPNVSRFAALYSSTGVNAAVTGKGPYTLFVPADSAFADLSPGALTGLTAAEKKRLVQYHVVSGKMLDLDAVSSGNHVALSKDSLNFTVQPQTKIAYVNSGYALKQYKTSNGIIYVITAVLVPPQSPNANGTTGSPVPAN